MNFMDSEEYSRDRREGDQVRKRVQRHKKDFDGVRREMRQAQQAFDARMGHMSRREEIDLENKNDVLIRQKVQLAQAKGQA